MHSRETNSATQQVCEQFTRHIGDNPTKATPVKFDIAIVLGSGLGAFTDNLPNPLTLPYETLPGFPDSGVTSHAGVLIVCQLWNKNVLVFAGREHFYEHGSADAMAPAIDLIADLGCKTLILTNAAGSLRKETGPGELVLIRDHINFSGKNPLMRLSKALARTRPAATGKWPGCRCSTNGAIFPYRSQHFPKVWSTIWSRLEVCRELSAIVTPLEPKSSPN